MPSSQTKYLVCVSVFVYCQTLYSGGIPYNYWKIRFNTAHLGGRRFGIGSGFYSCNPWHIPSWTPGASNLTYSLIPISSLGQENYDIVSSLLQFDHLIGIEKDLALDMVKELVHSVVKAAVLDVDLVYDEHAKPWGSGKESYPNYRYQVLSEQLETSVKPCTRYNEELWNHSMPSSLRIVRNSWELKWLEEHALFSALDNIPRMNNNTISFLRDICALLWGLRKGRLELPQDLSDLWLSYRYTYSTTKLDAEEICNFWKRNGGDTLNSWYRARGVAEYNDATCRCTLRTKNKVVETIQLLVRELDRYGLVPNWYMIWDSIPYSFIVDWFVPIGDLLEVADTSTRYFKKGWYEFSYITYSLSYEGTDQSGRICDYYSRYVSNIPPSIEGLYWLDPGEGTSLSTVTKRGLDLFALSKK